MTNKDTEQKEEPKKEKTGEKVPNSSETPDQTSAPTGENGVSMPDKEIVSDVKQSQNAESKADKRTGLDSAAILKDLGDIKDAIIDSKKTIEKFENITKLQQQEIDDLKKNQVQVEYDKTAHIEGRFDFNYIAGKLANEKTLEERERTFGQFAELKTIFR